MTFNAEHPELEDGEMFLSNTNEEGYQRIRWKTKRRGEVAYNIDGIIIDKQSINLFPVFVQKQEYDEGMEMKA